MQRPLSIAIAALGGQGGGVLADWIVAVAERCGWLVQSTSVPGVAQRTGTTVYYLEMCPQPTDPAKEPVFALMPVPGDVDVVIGAELMEAGRAVVRGFVTPDRTTLVASTHRVYGITEKSALGDGIADTNAVLAALRSEARRLVCFDMEAVCAQTGSLISSVLFGALAASGALPFARDAYEQAIRTGAVAVAENLAGFAAGFEMALKSAPVTGLIPPGPAPKSDAGRRLDAQVRTTYPAHLHGIIVEGDTAADGLSRRRLCGILSAPLERGVAVGCRGRGHGAGIRAHGGCRAASRALDVVRRHDSRGRSENPPAAASSVSVMRWAPRRGRLSR